MSDAERILTYEDEALFLDVGMATEPKTRLELPADHLELEEAVLAQLRELTSVAAPLVVRLDGMPTGLAVAITNAMTLCGRIHDRLELAERHLPFSRLHYLSDRPDLTLPQPMRERFDRINCELIRHTVTPEIYLNPDLRLCRIDNTSITLTDLELAVYWLLLLRTGNQLPPLCGIEMLAEEFQAFLASTASYVMPGVVALRHGEPDLPQLREAINQVAGKIAAAIPFEAGRFFCLPEPMPESFGLMLNAERINCPRNY
ncbi:MAG: hypothetical protein PHQ27_01210 [Victivallales bacterium]|nr:hypothetical protein [Victivallales bacterium]